MNAIRLVHPEWKSLDVRVTLVDEDTGFTSVAGVLRVVEEGLLPYSLVSGELPARLGNSRRVHLVLECDQTWRPIEVLPGSPDRRELTVQVFQAGFEP